MGRSPCCSKEGLNRGAWTAGEDKILADYIKTNGEGRWRKLPKNAGLERCGKSCRLRWLNYLRPDIKRGNISGEEEELIFRLHKLLGNRWSLIAGRLPGRTDNEIKNYWNTNLAKKVQKANSVQVDKPKASNRSREKENQFQPPAMKDDMKEATAKVESTVVRTKAMRCTSAFIPPNLDNNLDSQQLLISDSVIRKQVMVESSITPSLTKESPSVIPPEDNGSNNFMDFDVELCMTDFLDPEFLKLCGSEIQENDNWWSGDDDDNNNNNCSSNNDNMNSNYNCLSSSSDESLYTHQTMLEEWLQDDCFQINVVPELQSLASFLDSEED